MQNPLIAAFTIFFVSAPISVVTNRITDVIDKVILKRKENQRIEKQKKDWDNNQIIRRKFLSKYTLPESVLFLKNGEKDAIIAELPQIVSGIYIYIDPRLRNITQMTGSRIKIPQSFSWIVSPFVRILLTIVLKLSRI